MGELLKKAERLDRQSAKISQSIEDAEGLLEKLREKEARDLLKKIE